MDYSSAIGTNNSRGKKGMKNDREEKSEGNKRLLRKRNEEKESYCNKPFGTHESEVKGGFPLVGSFEEAEEDCYKADSNKEEKGKSNKRQIEVLGKGMESKGAKEN